MIPSLSNVSVLATCAVVGGGPIQGEAGIRADHMAAGQNKERHLPRIYLNVTDVSQWAVFVRMCQEEEGRGTLSRCNKLKEENVRMFLWLMYILIKQFVIQCKALLHLLLTLSSIYNTHTTGW